MEGPFGSVTRRTAPSLLNKPPALSHRCKEMAQSLSSVSAIMPRQITACAGSSERIHDNSARLSIPLAMCLCCERARGTPTSIVHRDGRQQGG